MRTITKKRRNMQKAMITIRKPRNRTSASTTTGGFAADLLQLQLLVTIGSIHDCSNGKSTAAPPELILVGLDSLRVEA